MSQGSSREHGMRPPRCRACGHPIAPAARFCGGCGIVFGHGPAARRIHVPRLGSTGLGIAAAFVGVVSVLIVAVSRVSLDGNRTPARMPQPRQQQQQNASPELIARMLEAAAAAESRTPLPMELLSTAPQGAALTDGVIALDPTPRPANDEKGRQGFNFFADCRLPAAGSATTGAIFRLQLTFTDANDLPLYNRWGSGGAPDGRLVISRDIAPTVADSSIRAGVFLAREDLVLAPGRHLLNVSACLLDGEGHTVGPSAAARWQYLEDPCYVTRFRLGEELMAPSGHRGVQVAIDLMCPPVSGGQGHIVVRFLRPRNGSPRAPQMPRELALSTIQFPAPAVRQLCRGIVWTVPYERLPAETPEFDVEVRLRNAATGDDLGARFDLHVQRQKGP